MAPYSAGAPNPVGWYDLGDTRSDPNPLWQPTGLLNLYMREINSNDGF